MALDERGYMRERASAQFEAWCSDDKPIRGHLEDIELLTAVQQNTLYSRPAARGTRPARSSGAKAAIVGALMSLAVIAAYRVAQDRPPEQAGTPDTHSPAPSKRHSAQAPKTYVAAPWQEGDETGRLVISVDSSAPAVRAVLSKDGITWEAFARSGETASIDLLPGNYTVQLFEYGRNQKGRQAQVTIHHPGDTFSFAVSRGH